MPQIGHNGRAVQVDGFTRANADERFLLPRRNLLINGGFDIWQRGNTGNPAPGNFTADRWRLRDVGLSGGTYSWERYSSANSGNYLKATFTGLTSISYFTQKIEDVRQAAGQKVTFSVELSLDSASYVALNLKQMFGSGGTPSSDVEAAGSGVYQPVPDSSGGWHKYTVTLDMPSVAGKTLGTDGNHHVELLLFLSNSADGTAPPVDGGYRIRNAQLEIGDVATPFEKRHIGEELALCQRYYKIISQNSYVAAGAFNSTNSVFFSVEHSPEMRTAPSVAYRALSDFDIEPHDLEISALSIGGAVIDGVTASQPARTRLTATTNTGARLGDVAILYIDTPGGYVDFDAEL